MEYRKLKDLVEINSENITKNYKEQTINYLDTANITNAIVAIIATNCAVKKLLFTEVIGSSKGTSYPNKYAQNAVINIIAVAINDIATNDLS